MLMTIKNILGDTWINANRFDTYSGQDLHISVTPQLKELIDWMLVHRAEDNRERALRQRDPNVKLAYDSYKMAVALAGE